MTRFGWLGLTVFAAPVAAVAQDAPSTAGSAIGANLFHSFDAEGTEVFKAGIDFDLRRTGPKQYYGFRVERARFRPLGDQGKTMERAYLRAADTGGDGRGRQRSAPTGAPSSAPRRSTTIRAFERKCSWNARSSRRRWACRGGSIKRSPA